MSSVRRLAGAATVAALFLVAVGCTSDSAENPPASPSPSTAATSAGSPGPVDLSFLAYGTDEQMEAYVDLANAFTKNHPNVTVTVDRAPDANAAMNNLANRFENGIAPDLFLTEHEALPELMREQWVQPVDALLDQRGVDFGDGYQRDALEAFSAESALQCMPHDVSPLVVYYNEDLLDLRSLVEEDEEPPNAEEGWTWDQFDLAARLIARGRIKGVFIEPRLTELAPFIWSGGGELADDQVDPTTMTLSDEDTREPLEQVLTLARDPQVTPTRAELERQGAIERFKNGRLGMILGTRELTPELRQAEDLEFEVMPLPSLGPYRTITQMTGYCISADTDALQAAADFLAFATSREGATITTTGGYVVPSNLQVAHSPAFLQPGKHPDNAFVFNEGVRQAGRMPFDPQWPDAVEQTRPYLERMFYAPVIDLDILLQQIDLASQPVLAPHEESPAAE